jgi:hypothetical protein
MKDGSGTFGSRRIYYNNFASHLLNAYNPNVFYPGLPYVWDQERWQRVLKMAAGFGYTAWEYWLPPRFFSAEGLKSPPARAFAERVRKLTAYAAELGLKTEMLCSLATTGEDWYTLCPKVPEERKRIFELWDRWTRELPGTDIVAVFPGDPGACSRNGCTAETFIDTAVEVAGTVRKNLPDAEIELHTWGPPFFGWGIIQGPPGWDGGFCPAYQHTAWTFVPERARRSMEHFLKRITDIPSPVSAAVNPGFNPDGDPAGEESAVFWARELSRRVPVQTWDFSLTEGENGIFPHWRFRRLYEKRRTERSSAPYRGGICFTMTPLLNQHSLYQASRSFQNPDGDPAEGAAEFYTALFGSAGSGLLPYLPLFEIVPDWGNRTDFSISKTRFHHEMKTLCGILADLKGRPEADLFLEPGPEEYRRELLWFARLFRDLSGPDPDFEVLKARYWNRVYAVYDELPAHVDPRPRNAVDRLAGFFEHWGSRNGPAPGQWV